MEGMMDRARTSVMRVLMLGVVVWLPSTAQAATAVSDQVTITWEPRPGHTFSFDLTGFAWSGAKPLGPIDAGLGRLVVPLPNMPPGVAGDDRWICARERDGKALTGCNQLALGPIVLPPAPAPQPIPQPQPVPVVPATVTMTGDQVIVQCDKSRFTKMKTTGTGTKRTITCLP
jgi:hypothetical protein